MNDLIFTICSIIFLYTLLLYLSIKKKNLNNNKRNRKYYV